jgi:hypothetical protein
MLAIWPSFGELESNDDSISENQKKVQRKIRKIRRRRRSRPFSNPAG